MTTSAADHQARVARMAEELRAGGRLGASELIARLFDFLLEQSLLDRSPKEIEIAQKVFGKDVGYDEARDASVRVYIHRLRRKLDEIYAGTTGERLTIPRGEYRLTIEAPAALEAAEEDAASPLPTVAEPPVAPAAPRPNRRHLAAAVAIILTFAAGALLGGYLWSGHGRSNRSGAVAAAVPWQPIAGNRRLTFVVTGDYYIFGEAPAASQVTRLVREFAINSRGDLDEYLMSHPKDYGRYVDLDLHYLPVSTGYALREVLPLVDDMARGAQVARPFVITMSRLTAEAMKGSNIIYVGFLSGLGLLRDPLFEASGFRVGASYDELIDVASGKHYISDWDEVTDNQMPRRDYAYLSSFPGPSGNRILVIAGTRDAAVTQAAEIAVDKAQLDQIAARTKGAANFEALYEVRTLGTLNLTSTLVLARPLKLGSLWRPGGPAEAFPDQMPTMAEKSQLPGAR